MRATLALLATLVAACRCGGAPDGGAQSRRQPPLIVTGSSGEAVSADGVRIVYAYEGIGSPAIVFVHGWSCDRSYWAAQVEAFMVDYRVVTLDLAGHGSTGASRPVWSFASFGEDVKAVVEALDLSEVVLVGHSMGGPIALEAARLMPDRVVGVIGVDTLHDADVRMDPISFGKFIEPFEQDFGGACTRFVRSMFLSDSDPELVVRVAADMCAASPEIAVPLLRLYEDYDLKAALRAVSVPIRCINSAAVPTDVEGNRRYAPDFDAVILEDVGHFPMLEKPVEFDRRLAEILAELGGKGAIRGKPVE